MNDNKDDIKSKVDLSNWRFPPYNRWAFQHVSELVESVDIENDPSNTWSLPENLQSIEHIVVQGNDGTEISFDQFLNQSFTDGFIVIKDFYSKKKVDLALNLHFIKMKHKENFKINQISIFNLKNQHFQSQINQMILKNENWLNKEPQKD